MKRRKGGINSYWLALLLCCLLSNTTESVSALILHNKVSKILNVFHNVLLEMYRVKYNIVNYREKIEALGFEVILSF